MDFNRMREKDARFVVSVACNPSGLGIDGAVVRIKGTGRGLSLKFIGWRSFPYSVGLRNRLMGVCCWRWGLGCWGWIREERVLLRKPAWWVVGCWVAE